MTYVPKKRIVLLLGYVGLLALSLYLAYFFRFAFLNHLVSPAGGAGILRIPKTGFFVFVLPYLVMLYVFGLHNHNHKFRSTAWLARFLLAFGMGSTLLTLVFYAFPGTRPGRGIFLLHCLFSVLSIALFRVALETYLESPKRALRVLIVGSGRAGKTLYEGVKGSTEYQVIGFLDRDPGRIGEVIGSPAIIGDFSMLASLSHNTEIIVTTITDDRDPHLIKALIDCKMKGIDVFDMPEFYERVTRKIPVEHLRNSYFIHSPFRGVRKSIYTLKAKRMIDIACAILGLIAGLPIMGLAALFIKLEDRGPIFYRQNRLGLGEETFELIKLRSMIRNAEQNGPVWADRRDRRVTRIGKWLRLLRVDEIPQMWNVLKGDMSFIGPRPERPEFVDRLKAEIPFYSLRHSIKPGISGWAQVNYPYGASTEDSMKKLQYDLFYLKHMSFLSDLHILLATIRVVVMTRGAR
jgi:sugar transferase (PEP-CTERM system associated)